MVNSGWLTFRWLFMTGWSVSGSRRKKTRGARARLMGEGYQRTNLITANVEEFRRMTLLEPKPDAVVDPPAE